MLIFDVSSVQTVQEMGTYSLPLVFLSYIVATLASYISLDFATHLVSTEKQPVSKNAIHLFGAFVLGAGIWAMHFIGMLAYQMRMAVTYDFTLTFFSMFIIICVTYLAFFIIRTKRSSPLAIGFGSIILGLGISMMHYSGMAAMEMQADTYYDLWTFALSIAIAIGASGAALIIFFTLSKNVWKHQKLIKCAAAVVMGIAICGMHYTGMAAAHFYPYADCIFNQKQNNTALTVTIYSVVAIIFLAALLFNFELEKKKNHSSILNSFVENVFYKNTYLLAVILSFIYGAIIFWQFTLIEKSITQNISQVINHQEDITALQPTFRIHANNLLLVLSALAMVNMVFILFFIFLIRRRESEVIEAKKELEERFHEKELMEIQLNAYVESIENAHSEVLDAKFSAEKANQSKSDFLANMSHEIRTPLNGVLGMAGLMVDTPLNEEQRGWLDIIRKSGENLLHIINDILDFSKIEAGKLDLELLPFSFINTLEDITDVMRLRAQDDGIELIVRVPLEMPPTLLGDAGRVRQVLLNLIGNAIKFTKKGHVLVSVDCISKDDMAHLHVEIQDTGLGIPSDKLDYIFSKFTQAEESTTRKFGGTGLGLAISKNLLEIMGGQIGVRSQLGEGATFYFDVSLPIAQTENSETSSTEISLKDSRVLVVDDYYMNCKVLKDYFDVWNAQCDTCASVEEALIKDQEAKDSGHPYDIIMLDYDMMLLTSKLCLNRNEHLNIFSDQARLVVLSNILISPVKEWENQKISGFLTKPYFPSQLKRILYQVLKDRDDGVQERVITRETLKNETPDNIKTSIEGLPQYTGKSVLAADDAPINLTLIKGVLKKYGIKADTATNGKEVISLLNSKHYDLIFMDCHMPEMDGFEATKIIREKENNNELKNIKIVAVTADAMVGDREKCLSAGMDDYIQKPLRFQEVEAVLEKYLDPKHSSTN